jgi:hypothetical protein
MTDHAQLNSLAEAEIAALRADGIQPTDAEIVKLNALGWAVETPHFRRTLARGCPVQVGGSTLWPLTIRAADWVDRVGEKMEPQMGYRFRRPVISSQISVYALAYAMESLSNPPLCRLQFARFPFRGHCQPKCPRLSP